MLPRGNDHVIEYNDFHHVCREFIDLGAIYINAGGEPLERGWIIRRNYFHDIAAAPDSPVNVEGVYFDHGTSGGLVEENIFHRIGRKARPWAGHAVFASGLQTTARHNLFVDCTNAWHDKAKESPEEYLAYRHSKYQWGDYLRRFDPGVSPHLKKYPEVRPLFAGGPAFSLQDMWNRFDGNVIWNPSIPRYKSNGIATENKDPKKTPVAPLIATQNFVTDADPGFVDAAKGDFTLRSDAPVFAHIPGFPKIPFTEIGLNGPVGP